MLLRKMSFLIKTEIKILKNQKCMKTQIKFVKNINICKVLLKIRDKKSYALKENQKAELMIPFYRLP